MGLDPGDARVTSAPTNLFASLDLTPAADALKASMPDDWTLRQAVVLQYGSKRVSVEIRREQGTVWILPEHQLRGPYEVILQVETGSRPGPRRWSLVPVTRRGSDWHAREGQRLTRRVRLEAPPPPDAANYALSFAPDARPFLLPASSLPSMHGSASFTAELWMRTTGLDEVVLSTWSGSEREPYPLEVVVDGSGRLRSYCGRRGRHQALTAPDPVADGRWHHVAVVHAAERHTLRLLVDGAVVDSVTNVRLPASRGASPGLALGGRLPASSTSEPSRRAQFSGAVDEVRLWASARSTSALRAAMRRPSVQGEAIRAQLEFDDEQNPPLEASWPSGVDRIPSTLALRTAVQDLQATAEGSTVRLQWATDARHVESFVVERSTDGATFTPLATVDPDAGREPTTEERRPQYAFTDEDVSAQVVFYRIRQVYPDGAARTSGVLKMGLGAPATPDSTVNLLGNFPNPFTETTTIAYEVNERVPIALSVWNLTGNRVAHLVDAVQAPGRYEQPFDASDLPSGTYFVRLRTPNERHSHRMVVLK